MMIAIFRWLNPIIRGYHSLADFAQNILAVARLAAPAIFLSLSVSVSFFIPQTREVIRVFAENWIDAQATFIATPLSLVLASVCIWYCARILLYQLAPSAFLSSGVCAFAARYLPRILGSIPSFALAIACFASADEIYNVSGRLKLIGVVSILWGIFFVFLTTVRGRIIDGQRNSWLRKKLDDPQSTTKRQVIRFRELPRAARCYIIVSNLLWVILILLSAFSNGDFARKIGTISILLLGVSAWLPLISGIYYFGQVCRFPALTAFVLAALLFSLLDLNDNHALRTLPDARKGLPEDTAAAFDRWLASRSDLNSYHKGDYPVFFIAAEGGGIRTAYNTAIVLSAIQDANPAFAQHVFAISGVSGGSVGATVFSALCADHAINVDHAKHASKYGDPKFKDMADFVLREDLLSPLVASAIFPDLLQRFLPFKMQSFDRALALEKGIESAWSKTMQSSRMGGSFFQLTADQTRAVPNLFLNTTIVETGERMAISSLYPTDERFARLLSLADLQWNADIRASTAAFASARFTYVTPVASFQFGGTQGTAKKLRIADGGYFENSGAATLASIIASLRFETPVVQGGRQGTCRIVVVSLTSPSPVLVSENGSIDHPKYLPEIASPIRALLNTRAARGVNASEMLELATCALVEGGQPAELIRFNLVQNRVELPLGWLLSNQARTEIIRQLGVPDPPPDQYRGDEYAFGRVLSALAAPK